MNTTALLALIGELYSQVAALNEENAELRKRLEEVPAQAAAPAS